jgi:hypothetical protein
VAPDVRAQEFVAMLEPCGMTPFIVIAEPFSKVGVSA